VVPYKFSSTNLFNTYNILATTSIGRSDFLHEEDSEDEEDSHDEDDDQQPHIGHQQILSSSTSSPPPFISVNSKKPQLLTSRSFSPSVFCQRKHHQYDQKPSKKSFYHSHHQDRSTKNIMGQHESTSALDSYAQNSINTMLTSSYPSVTHGK
jgi:hypothetical protein